MNMERGEAAAFDILLRVGPKSILTYGGCFAHLGIDRYPGGKRMGEWSGWGRISLLVVLHVAVFVYVVCASIPDCPTSPEHLGGVVSGGDEGGEGSR